MAFNGSGTFVPLITFQPNTPATAEDQNTQDSDIANGLTDCVTRDGQSPALNNIPMGGFRLTGLGTPIAATDGSTKAYVDSSVGAGVTVGTTPVVGGTSGSFLYNNSNVLGNTAATGTGDVVLATNATLTTPTLTTPTSSNETMTGTPVAPTAALGTNTTQIATTAFVQNSLANVGPSVRQTVWSGPVSSSTGLPTFLPSTSSNLNLTTQSITSSIPLVLVAANGFSVLGPVNILGGTTTNLTWTSLTGSTTVYLYVTVASNGTLTTGFTTSVPIYQYAGTPATTSGQFTFNTSSMIGYMGNGSSAPQANIVFVGECTTTTSVTATVAYAYNGYFDSGYTATLPEYGTQTSFTTNLGIADALPTIILLCTTANTYAVGDVVTNPSMQAQSGIWGPITTRTVRNSASFTPGADNAFVLENPSTGSYVVLTAADWSYRMTVKRQW